MEEPPARWRAVATRDLPCRPRSWPRGWCAIARSARRAPAVADPVGFPPGQRRVRVEATSRPASGAKIRVKRIFGRGKATKGTKVLGIGQWADPYRQIALPAALVLSSTAYRPFCDDLLLPTHPPGAFVRVRALPSSVVGPAVRTRPPLPVVSAFLVE